MREREYKGYKIVNGGFQTREIKSIGSGALPKALRGKYSNTAQAEYAIDTLELEKGAKRAKAVSTS